MANRLDKRDSERLPALAGRLTTRIPLYAIKCTNESGDRLASSLAVPAPVRLTRCPVYRLPTFPPNGKLVLMAYLWWVGTWRATGF